MKCLKCGSENPSDISFCSKGGTQILLSKQRDVPHYEIALVYLALGKKDKGFEFLEKAYSERSSALVRIKLDPRLDSLHSDPRFTTLLEKMNLE